MTYEIAMGILERFGLPTLFACFLMFHQARKQDEMLATLTRLTIVVVVLAQVWDIDVNAILEKSDESDETDKE